MAFECNGFSEIGTLHNLVTCGFIAKQSPIVNNSMLPFAGQSTIPDIYNSSSTTTFPNVDISEFLDEDAHISLPSQFNLWQQDGYVLINIMEGPREAIDHCYVTTTIWGCCSNFLSNVV